jgi:hypothetical protein
MPRLVAMQAMPIGLLRALSPRMGRRFWHSLHADGILHRFVQRACGFRGVLSRHAESMVFRMWRALAVLRRCEQFRCMRSGFDTLLAGQRPLRCCKSFISARIFGARSQPWSLRMPGTRHLRRGVVAILNALPILCFICNRGVSVTCAADSSSLFGVMAGGALFAFFCVVASAAAKGGVPIVDVSLAPAEPSPALASSIASFDAARESLEGTASASDVRAFNAALQDARPRIDAVAKQAVRALMAGGGRAASSSSFFGSDTGMRGGHGDEAVLEVGVVAGEEADGAAVVAAARALEAKWAAMEVHDFSARLADFKVLTDAMVRSANVAMQSLLASRGRTGASFVARPTGAASEPSTAAIAGMEARRAVGEALSRAKHLTLALALVQRENGMLRVALRREAAAVRSSGASFIGASSAGTLGQYVINLQPPQEDVHDVDEAIDDIMSAEREKQRASNAQFSEEKRRALDVGGLALQKSVRRVRR